MKTLIQTFNPQPAIDMSPEEVAWIRKSIETKLILIRTGYEQVLRVTHFGTTGDAGLDAELFMGLARLAAEVVVLDAYEKAHPEARRS